MPGKNGNNKNENITKEIKILFLNSGIQLKATDKSNA
jgi:hypothetical protein